MKLTPLQYRALKNNWHFHTRGWSAAYLLRQMGLRWMLLGMLGLAGGFVLWSLPFPWASGFVGGMVAGAILRDVGALKMTYRIWPISDEIIHWPRVTELIEAHETQP